MGERARPARRAPSPCPPLTRARSYVQGMSYLAGNLLLYIVDPYTAFVAFANLLNSPFFLVFLRLDKAQMQKR